MTAMLVDGTAVAARVRTQVATDVAGLAAPPGLATVLVGDDLVPLGGPLWTD